MEEEKQTSIVTPEQTEKMLRAIEGPDNTKIDFMADLAPLFYNMAMMSAITEIMSKEVFNNNDKLDNNYYSNNSSSNS